MRLDSIENKELRLFVDSVRNYFKKITMKEAEITSAFLGTGDVEGYEFNGIVTFSGSYNGQIIVSMPKQLLRELLIMQKEIDLTDENLLDIVGEIANTLAGNARKKLDGGDDLNISVPVKFQGNATSTRSRVRQHPYIIILSWMKCPALVCVDISKI